MTWFNSMLKFGDVMNTNTLEYDIMADDLELMEYIRIVEQDGISFIDFCPCSECEYYDDKFCLECGKFIMSETAESLGHFDYVYCNCPEDV